MTSSPLRAGSWAPVHGALAASLPPSAELAHWRALFDEIGAGSSERERERILPFAQVKLLKQARFGALRLTAADGGAGASFRQLYHLTLELAAVDANVAHIFRNHFTVAEQFARHPYDARSRQWQTAVRSGAVFGLASSEAGSNPAGGFAPDTRLLPEGDRFRLEGVKYYSTGTLFGDSMLVRAATPDGRVAAVIIPTGREGIEIVDDWDGAGQRLTASGTTRFHGVRVEADEAVFDTPERGYGLAYSNTQAQLFLTTVVAGIAKGALTDAVALVQRRKRSFYYAPTPVPADDPLLHEAIGRLAANAFAAEAIILSAADAIDRASEARERGETAEDLSAEAAKVAAQAKLVIDDLALKSASLLFDVGGASATERAANLDRHWRNARTIASHNPSSYKAKAIGALLVTGEPLPSKGFF
ncbi:acyl-CoA dehydrogenase family protein [Aquabacter cavernae]|uniref:acyl-CoA dehydrogenase family protein n=1 Tax=Aquabacter cavernae TaxID=2496029 RepID=UPI000F8D51BC|nr:acyl-CoA dehydrogenase family protein [Aquabacter cavernae]